MKRLLSVLLCLVLSFSLVSCEISDTQSVQKTLEYYSLDNLPQYSGKPYVAINNNIPRLTISEKDYTSYEVYSPLDYLGRCGECVASIGPDIMPTEKRESIGMVKPSGWQIAKYDFVDGKYLYNRCHLIGFQLTGENANECNLITGTRTMNTEGMLPFENMVADYVKETKNHVLYRVTPVFEGENLVASGVIIEGLSVEDMGAGISFCVYCYNVEPGVVIDYKTGNNELDINESENEQNSLGAYDYVINIASDKFHLPDCSGVATMKPTNKEEFRGTRAELIQKGYSPCGLCNP